MIQHSRDHSLQLSSVGSDGVPASFAVGKSHHSVDTIGQAARRETFRDKFHRVRRAITGGGYGNVVPGARPPIGARVTEKRRDLGRAHRFRDFNTRVRLAQRDLFEREIVRMDMLSRMNAHRRLANHAAVTNHR